MATVGKKKLNQISQISEIHDVLIDELRDDAKFLDDSPEWWDRQQKQLYDLLIAHENRIKERVFEILNNKSK